MKDGLISIGEMSDICRVSKRTLRYYDTIGLVTPAYVNEENGYRYYEPYQVGRIHLVKQMQELGIALEEVAQCVREKGSEISLEEFYRCISEREFSLKTQIQDLLHQQEQIHQYITQYDSLQKTLHSVDEEIHIIYLPKRYLVCKCFTGKLNPSMFGRTFAEIGSNLQNRSNSSYEILPQIGSCYRGRRNTDTCVNYIGFFTDKSIDATPFNLEVIEEGYFATYRVQGGYQEIGPHYQYVYEYLNNMHYKPLATSVEIYTSSPSLHLNEKEYITELQVAINLHFPS